MGAAQSKPENLSVEEISSYVANLGAKYEACGEAVAAFAVDGKLLVAMDDDEFKETLQCLGVTNFLLQKKLTQEWYEIKGGSANKVDRRGVASNGTPRGNPGLDGSLTSYTAAESITEASSSTVNSGLTNLSSPSANWSPSVEGQSKSDVPLGLSSSPPLTVSFKQKQVLSALNYPKSLPPDAPELHPFRQIANKAHSDCQGIFTQVNLLDTASKVEPGKKVNVNNLTSTLSVDSPPQRLYFDGPDDLELCRSFVLKSQEDFHMEDLPKEVTDLFGCGRSKYYGHIVRYGTVRVGTICVNVEKSNTAVTPEQIRNVLQFLATLVEAQLGKREALLRRSQNLREDLKQLRQQEIDPVLAPSFGPLEAITASQLSSRQSFFPYPEESGEHHDGCPTQPQYNRRTATLPAFTLNMEQPIEAERSHLKPTYYENAFFDPSNGIYLDKPPVGKRDMERAAVLHSLQLLQMDPLCEEAKTIQSLVDLTAKFFQADIACVDLLDHQHNNGFFMTFPNHTGSNMDTLRAIFESEFVEVVSRHPHTGQTFHIRMDRAISMCNYGILTPNNQAFVIHDVGKDQSTAAYSQVGGCGFYCTAPIVVRGYNMGVLCCMNQHRNLEFSRVQEMQLEGFAHLISQQYETWALQREVNHLERARKMLSTGTEESTRAERPENYAALVFTGVHEAAALWESSSKAMNGAIGLYNKILRSKIAQNRGYEVSTEKNAFQVAFSDVVDAINFSLQTQEALHTAPWEQDILALTDTCDEASFHGLKIRMAIHCGDVETTTEPASGRVIYTGETLHIAKNLVAMTHGGQILVTSDAWNSVCHLAQSTLGSPQVIDLGSHAIPTMSNHMHDGLTINNVLQLVPSSLAFDYRCAQRSQSGDAPSNVFGRTFPPIKTKKAVTPSFHEAPYNSNLVAMVYLDTSEVEKMVEDSGLLLVALSKHAGAVLQEQQDSGYQCNFMLAFEESTAAVRFGLALQESLKKQKILDMSLKGKVKIGVHEGVFESLIPNPITGRADYFGKVVHRVEQIAQAVAPGCVYLGKEVQDMDEFNLQPISNGFMLDFTGRHFFEEVKEEFTLYKCHPCKSWYDTVLDSRGHDLQSPWRDL